MTTPNEIKKDCERKAKDLINKHYRMGNLDRIAETRLAQIFADAISDALLSEHLIVQKRVEELEKEVEIQDEQRSKLVDTHLEEENGMQKQIDSLQKRVDELKQDAETEHKAAVIESARADEMQKQIDELKKS